MAEQCQHIKSNLLHFKKGFGDSRDFLLVFSLHHLAHRRWDNLPGEAILIFLASVSNHRCGAIFCIIISFQLSHFNPHSTDNHYRTYILL